MATNRAVLSIEWERVRCLFTSIAYKFKETFLSCKQGDDSILSAYIQCHVRIMFFE